MSANHDGDPLNAYLGRSRVAQDVLKAVRRNWQHGWTTTCAQLQSAWSGIHSASTIAHTFTELHRLGAIARKGGDPWVYRPRLEKFGETFALSKTGREY